MKIRTAAALSLLMLGILLLFPERNRSQVRPSEPKTPHKRDAMALPPEQTRPAESSPAPNAHPDSLRITFGQWNQCLIYRTAKSSECLKEVAQELSRTVAAGLSGPDWSKEELSLSYAVVDRFVDDGARKCREPKGKVRTALQLNLLSCPL